MSTLFCRFRLTLAVSCLVPLLAILLGSSTCQSGDEDQDGYTSSEGDCDDSDASVYPGAAEVCDGRDNDCDLQIDEGVNGPWYVDQDGDGYGAGSGVLTCAPPPGYVTASGDCDDSAPAVHPYAPESCNGIDDNCDGLIDGAAGGSWYLDRDGDGYGSGGATSFACDPASGYVTRPGDCDDADTAVHPGAPEVCDGRDNDCDKATPELHLYYIDADGDGFGAISQAIVACTSPAGFATKTGDCDDQAPTTWPGAPELCDGLDNDCTGVPDDFLTYYFRDRDGDGFGDATQTVCQPTAGYTPDRGDCDDGDNTRYPGATDKAGDGIDQDCGSADGPQPTVGLGSSSSTSLQQAIDAAVNGATVWVGPGTYLEHDLDFKGRAITLISTRLMAVTVIDARSQGSGVRFVSGEGRGSVLDGFTVQGGETTGLGGGIYIEGSSPTINGCLIAGGTAGQGGGGVAIRGGSPVLSSCRIAWNSVYHSTAVLEGDHYVTVYDRVLGGGIYVSGARPVIDHCQILDNSVLGAGGGIYLEDVGPSTLISASAVTGNKALASCTQATDPSGIPCYSTCSDGGSGGGIYVVGSSPSITGSTVSQNTSAEGGGLYLDNAPARVSGSLFGANTAASVYIQGDCGSTSPYPTDWPTSYQAFGGSGGGLYLDGSSPALTSTVVDGNSAAASGGGLAILANEPSISHSTISNNVTTGSCSYTVTACPGTDGLTYQTLSCLGARGGGMYLWTGSPVVSSSTIYGNSANEGGGLFAEGGQPRLTSSTWSVNRAVDRIVTATSFCYDQDDYATSMTPGRGGAMYLHASQPSISNSRIDANNAGPGCAEGRTDNGGAQAVGDQCSGGPGGGLYLDASSPTLDNCALTGNTAFEGAAAFVEGGSSPRLNQSTLVGNRIEPVCDTTYGDNSTPMPTSCIEGHAGGLSLTGSTATATIQASILAYNGGYNLYGADGSSAAVASSDLYTPAGGLNSNLPIPLSSSLPVESGTNLSLEPGFLAYAAGLPSSLHLALGSPMIDVGGSSPDVDGSPADVGSYGGPGGGLWDLDGDGYMDWYWPGTIADAPAGVDADAFDCDDGDGSIPTAGKNCPGP